MSLASVVAAACGYCALVIVARSLTPARNAEFLVYWSLMFGGFGLLGGLQQESTRAVGTAALVPRSPGRPGLGAGVLRGGLVCGGLLAALCGLAAPWWQPALLGQGSGRPIVVVLCVTFALYAGHLTLVGTLAGRGRWGASSALIAGESLARAGLIGAAALLGTGLLGLQVAAALPATLWLTALVLSRQVRSAASARADVAGRALFARFGQAMLASTSAAALVVGFPTLLRASTSAEVWTSAAPLVLAISMTRAPLLLPLGAFQGVAIRYFLDPRHDRSGALARLAAVILVVGILGAVLAWFVGPTLMTTFFGPSYVVSGALLGGLTLASTALAMLTMTGSAVLALGRHGAYAVAWLTATAVSVAVLLTGLPLDVRATASLVAGPMVGVLVHVLVALRTSDGLRASGSTGSGDGS